MLSLIRRGPKILIMESSMTDELKQYLKNKFSSAKSILDVGEAFEKSSEESTIILFVEKLKEVIHLNDIKYYLTIKEDSDAILCTLFSDKKCHLITNCRIAPQILIMRAFGDMEKILEEIKKDHNASSGSFIDMLDNHNEQGTIIALTPSPLNKNLHIKDLYHKALFVEEKYSPLRKSLRLHGLKYLNEGIGNKDWYELEIKIYDIYGAYELHYQRLLKVLEYHELGIILGESWGKDAAHILLSVGVYRIRFFTFYEPKYIKKILLGLEYLPDGTRIVDYDVYHKRKKIYWTDTREEKIKEKSVLSKKYRNLIFNELTENQAAVILELEKQILATRN